VTVAFQITLGAGRKNSGILSSRQAASHSTKKAMVKK
jgi:hypothetical protein